MKKIILLFIPFVIISCSNSSFFYKPKNYDHTGPVHEEDYSIWDYHPPQLWRKMSENELREIYIRNNFQRMLLASLMMQLSYSNFYSENKYVDILNDKNTPNFKKRYKSNSRQKWFSDRSFVNDLLYLSPPPECKLKMKIKRLDLLDTASIIFLGYKYLLYEIDISTEINRLKFKDGKKNTLGLISGLEYECDSFDFKPLLSSFFTTSYNPKAEFKPASFKGGHYLIGVNVGMEIKDPNLEDFIPQKNDLLYLSKELLLYEQSKKRLIDILNKNCGYMDSNQKETFIDYLRIICYSDHQAEKFTYIKTTKKKLHFTCYSNALERQMNVSVMKQYPYDIEFYEIKTKR